MKKITLFFIAIVTISCSNKKQETSETTEVKTENASPLESAKWLVGEWKDVSKEGTLTETWTSESDSSLQARTFFITPKNETVFSEKVRLVSRNGNLIYIAQAYGQNGDKPIEFAMTKNDSKEMVFENPKHDYPTKIVYENYGDSLKATISGREKGVEKKEEFPMKKVK